MSKLDNSDEIAKLQSEVTSLELENQKLKKENDNLSSMSKEDYNVTFSQYTFAKIISNNAQNYCNYIIELNKITGNVSYSDDIKKEKTSEYINNLSLEYGQKIILYKFQFPNDSTYNSDIVDYLNERDDITYDEMSYILEVLGFDVSENGIITW